MLRKTRIADKIRNHDFLYQAAFYGYTFLPQQMQFIKTYLIDRHFSKQYDFKSIRKYKNIHNGELCFVVGTAPSLQMADLELIKNYTAFSCNSIVLAFDKTDWRPSYYGVQDRGVNKLRDKIMAHQNEFRDILVGVTSADETPDIGCPAVNYILQRLDHSKRGIKHCYKATSRADKYLYDGYSIVYSMLELAMYMGFRDIVLLGVDCDYSSKNAHFIEYTKDRDQNASIKMYKAYECIRKFAESRGIRIRNASRGWKLDVFECVRLEEILQNKREKDQNMSVCDTEYHNDSGISACKKGCFSG